MNHAILINHGVAFRRQRAAQADVGIELAILVEVHDAQRIGFADFSARGLNVAPQQTKQRGLAAPVRTHKSHAHARRDR